MKPRASIVLFIICLGLGALLLVQWRQLKDAKQQNDELQMQVEKMQGEIQAAQTKVAQAESARATLQTQVDAMALQMASPRVDLSKPAEASEAPEAGTRAGNQTGEPARGASNPMAIMAEMMKNPETREAFEQQQQFALNMMYGPLFEKLGLSEEAEEEFKKALLEQHMSTMERATEMMDQSNTNRAFVAEELAAEKATWDERMTELLGPEKFEQFQEFQLTMGERMMMNQQMKLPPEQMDQLLGIIAEEKRALQMTQMPGMDPAQNPELILQDGFMEQQLANQQTVNNAVYERARAMLTAEQLAKLDEFLQGQLKMQQAALQMAKRMMKPDAGLAPASPMAEQP